MRCQGSLPLLLNPARGVLGETRALNSDNAKALPCRGLHHHPAFQTIYYFGPQSLQAGNLGWNIVSFNIDMNPALMLDALDLDNGFIWRSFQHAVVSARPGVVGIDCTAKRIGPELGRLINIRCAAINQKCAEAGVVHRNLLECGSNSSRVRSSAARYFFAVAWIFSPLANISTNFSIRAWRVSSFFAVCIRQHTA